jgi:hypothetical protein
MAKAGGMDDADGASTAPLLQGSFTSGELAPALYARTDLAKFHSGAKLLRNFFVQAQGGVLNRAGTRYVGAAAGGDTPTRLIPFSFNLEQTYALVFTAGSIQFVADGGFVTVDGTVTGAPVTVATPYNGADLFDITFCQSADVLTLCHPSYPPAQLTRQSATAWTYAPITVGSKLSPPVINQVLGINQGYPNGNTMVQYLAAPFTYALTAVSVDPPDESALGTSLNCFNYDLSYYNYGVYNGVFWFQPNDPRVDHVNVYRYYNGTYSYVASTSGVTRDGGVQQWNDVDITPDTNISPPQTINPFSTASFTGSISGTLLTVSAVAEGSMALGQVISGVSVAPGTEITGIPSGVVFQGSISGTLLNVTAITSGNLTNATFSGSITGTTLTVGALQGYIGLGNTVLGTGVAANTTITAVPDSGGPGAYSVSNSQTVATEPMSIAFATGSSAGTLAVGQTITGPNVTAGTVITSLGTGTGGIGTYHLNVASTPFMPSPKFPVIDFLATTSTVGTYTVNNAQTVASEPMVGDPNYPAACGFFQQRAIFGGSPINPQQIITSRTGNYGNFNVSRPLQDSDAITLTISSGQVNEIRHLVAVNDLIVFTNSGAWKLSGQSNSGDVITPSNVICVPQAYSGCSNVPPIVISPSIIYVQEKGASVRDLSYNVYTSQYTGTDLAVLSSHLFFGYQIVDWAFAREPWKIVWATRNDGVLLGLTYLKEQDVYAWHRHDTAATYGDAPSTFQSVCSISEGSEDVVYVCVRRFLNGAWVRCIERMQSRVLGLGDSDITAAWFVDCGLQYSGAPTKTVSGLTHLMGQTVAILADGAVKDQQVVSATGTVTINVAASVITVGLPIQAQMETLPIDAGEPTVQGKFKRLTHARLFVSNTRGLKAGPDTPTGPALEEIRARGNEAWGAAPALFTGQQLIHPPGNWDTYGSMWVQQDYPLPACVLGIEPWMSVGQ